MFLRCEWPAGCHQQAEPGDPVLCYFHTKVRDGLIDPRQPLVPREPIARSLALLGAAPHVVRRARRKPARPPSSIYGGGGMPVGRVIR